MRRENLDRYIEFANDLANTARETLKGMANLSIQPVYKADFSPVTEQDKTIERVLRQRIGERFPDHGIYGEELGSENIDAQFVWVLDPIDGTSSFVAGLPTYCTLIGLCFEGRPVLGLIDNVVTKSRWIGAEGVESTLNGIPLNTRSCSDLTQAVVTTYSPELFRGGELEALNGIISRTRMTVYGGNSYAYGRLAGGFIDLGIEAQHDVSDYIALVPVISGAGGVVSDWEGRPLTLASGDRFIASGDSRIHSVACELLSGAASSV